MNFLEAPGSPGAHSMNASVLRHLPVAAATLAAVSALLLSGCSSVPLENAPIVNRNASSGETMAPVTTGSTASHALVGGVEDSGRTHVVAPGDTIYNISQRYGLDASALMQLNAVRDPTTLRLGQTLHLPVSVREGSTAIAPGVRVHRVETADAFASEHFERLGRSDLLCDGASRRRRRSRGRGFRKDLRGLREGLRSRREREERRRREGRAGRGRHSGNAPHLARARQGPLGLREERQGP